MQLFLLHLGQGVLGLPLEGGEGFRYKHRRRAGDPQALGPLLPWYGEIATDHLAGQVGNTVQILKGFRGQAHHKVQLYAAPAALEGVGNLLHQVGLGHALVDHVPQALGARLGGKGEGGFAYLLGFLQRFLQHAVDAKRRQADGHPLVGQALHQFADQLRQTGIVAAGQAGQADFLISRGTLQLFGKLHQALQAALAHRAVQHARLAEAAATGAAAHDLQHDAVVNDLRIGHGNLRGIGGLVQVSDNGLDHLGRGFRAVGRKGRNGAVLMVGHIVQRRHIDAAQGGKALHAFFAGLAGFLPFQDGAVHLDDGLLAIADHKGVDEVRQGLRVEGTGPAGHHDGIFPAAVLPQQRNAAKLQHGQDVGIAHLILQGEAHHIKLIQCAAVLQGKQRYVFLLHQGHHVHPRHADPLTQAPGLVVDNGVKNLHAQVGHGNLVGIGKAEGKVQLRFVPGLQGGVHFAAGVAWGLLHLLQHGFDLIGVQGAASFKKRFL